MLSGPVDLRGPLVKFAFCWPAKGLSSVAQILKTKMPITGRLSGPALNFHCHLHILVSADGLQESQGRIISRIHFAELPLMRMWKYAVITHLRQR